MAFEALQEPELGGQCKEGHGTIYHNFINLILEKRLLERGRPLELKYAMLLNVHDRTNVELRNLKLIFIDSKDRPFTFFLGLVAEQQLLDLLLVLGRVPGPEIKWEIVGIFVLDWLLEAFHHFLDCGLCEVDHLFDEKNVVYALFVFRPFDGFDET